MPVDLTQLVTSALASLGITLPTALWLSQTIVKESLSRGTESHKSELRKEVDEYLGKRSAELRKEVDEYLGERSAERSYNWEARKRLYQAIGPLRFRLLMACRDLSNRIIIYSKDQKYSFSMNRYFGKNTLYRILRPIAISELIERQMAYSDFQIDPTGIRLLKLKKSLFSALSSGKPILDHPSANWDEQYEHIYSGNLVKIANSMIVDDEIAFSKERIMHYHEFDNFISYNSKLDAFHPLPSILNDFSISHKPIFWIRLVCLSYICTEFIVIEGNNLEFGSYTIDVEKMLLPSSDEFTLKNIKLFEDKFSLMSKDGL